MVDETTHHVSTKSQCNTVIRYVKEGSIECRFLDMRAIDVYGQTGENLFKFWNAVAADYDLDTFKHTAIALLCLDDIIP